MQMSEIINERLPFDFESHRKNAVEQYAKKRKLYEEFAWEIENILNEAVETHDLKINVIQSRAKDEKSFGKKAMTPDEENPEVPKYNDPLVDITDLAGVRVITFFPSTVKEVCQLVQDEFDAFQRVDHTVRCAQVRVALGKFTGTRSAVAAATAKFAHDGADKRFRIAEKHQRAI
jgi:ppGpp synthetase/RelA/SpoT-type nucleotidyltranferase